MFSTRDVAVELVQLVEPARLGPADLIALLLIGLTMAFVVCLAILTVLAYRGGLR